MSKVYVVTKGEYSDFHIVCVFSDEMEAKRIADLIDGDVENYELDVVKAEDPGQDFFCVVLARTGKVEIYDDSRLDGFYMETGGRRNERCGLRTHKDDPWKCKDYWRLIWYGYAESKEHARRHVEELRRQILAGQRPAEVDFGKN